MTRGRIRARAAETAAGVAWAAGAAATLLFFHLRSSADPPRGDVSLTGLEAPVEVAVDSFGIPHLFAAGRVDLYRAQGFVHARDRLWQMDFLRRLARGRLAEVFGERALGADRFVRTLDLWGAAGRALERLDPHERALLEAYAEGVEAGRRSLPAPPLEMWLLRVDFEPWSARAALAVGMMMNLDLSHWRHEVERHVARGLLSPEKLAYLALPPPEWGPSILPDPVPVPRPGLPLVPPLPETADAVAMEGVGVGRRPARAAEPHGGRPEAWSGLRRVAREGTTAEGWDPWALLAAHSLRAASNAWVVGPQRVVGGGAILANDMHLGLRAPSLWYLAGLHGGETGPNVAGLTLPGVPGVIVGYNRGVAWGFTNGMVDDMDFVREEGSADGLSYRLGEAWVPYAVRAETIAVRGRAAPEVWEVRETARGPLLSDVLGGVPEPLSAVWVAALAEWDGTGVLGLADAETLEAFDRAVTRFAAPHQNVVFAAVPGRIAYRLGGTVPLRDGWDGALPVGRRRLEEHGVRRWPRGAHPSGREPADGFFATANNLQAPGLHGVVGADYPVPTRARRLADRLAESAAWDAPATEALQRDTRSLLADRLVEMAARAAEAAGAETAARRLRGWDREVSLGSHGAPIFYAWLYRLRELLAADEFAAEPRWGLYPVGALLSTLQRGDADPWVDDVRTPERETLAALAERAMRDVLPRVQGRVWGDLHAEVHVHPLGEVGWLDRLFGLHVGPHPSPGGPHTLRPDDYNRWAPLDSTSWVPPWTGRFGPTQRFVAEVGEEGIEARFLLPTGQSGSPLAPHYRDMNPRWRAGGPLVPVPIDEDAARRRAVHTYRLVPEER